MGVPRFSEVINDPRFQALEKLDPGKAKAIREAYYARAQKPTNPEAAEKQRRVIMGERQQHEMGGVRDFAKAAVNNSIIGQAWSAATGQEMYPRKPLSPVAETAAGVTGVVADPVFWGVQALTAPIAPAVAGSRLLAPLAGAAAPKILGATIPKMLGSAAQQMLASSATGAIRNAAEQRLQTQHIDPGQLIGRTAAEGLTGGLVGMINPFGAQWDEAASAGQKILSAAGRNVVQTGIGAGSDVLQGRQVTPTSIGLDLGLGLGLEAFQGNRALRGAPERDLQTTNDIPITAVTQPPAPAPRPEVPESVARNLMGGPPLSPSAGPTPVAPMPHGAIEMTPMPDSSLEDAALGIRQGRTVPPLEAGNGPVAEPAARPSIDYSGLVTPNDVPAYLNKPQAEAPIPDARLLDLERRIKNVDQAIARTKSATVKDDLIRKRSHLIEEAAVLSGRMERGVKLDRYQEAPDNIRPAVENSNPNLVENPVEIPQEIEPPKLSHIEITPADMPKGTRPLRPVVPGTKPIEQSSVTPETLTAMGVSPEYQADISMELKSEPAKPFPYYDAESSSWKATPTGLDAESSARNRQRGSVDPSVVGEAVQKLTKPKLGKNIEVPRQLAEKLQMPWEVVGPGKAKGQTQLKAEQDGTTYYATVPDKHVESWTGKWHVVKEEGDKVTITRGAKPEYVASAQELLTKKPVYSGEERIENMNINRVGGPDDVKAIFELAGKNHSKTFVDAKRGVVPLAESAANARKKLAGMLGKKEEWLLKRQKGQAFNDEQVIGALDVVESKATFLSQMAERGRNGQLTEIEQAEFALEFEKFVAIAASAYGGVSETARALNAAKVLSKALDSHVDELREAMKSWGGGEQVTRLAELIAADPKRAAEHALKAAGWRRLSNGAIEYYINSILSGPQTHIVNVTGNSLALLAKVAERYGEAAVGAVTRNKESTNFRGANAEMFAAINAIQEAFGRSWKAFKTGDSSFEGSMLEVNHKAIPGPIGEVIRTPGRALQAQDDFFKTFHFRMEVSRQAYIEAAKRNLKGDALKTFIADAISNPDSQITRRAMEEAKYRTFNQSLNGKDALTQAGSFIQAYRINHPWVALFVPFIRTPVNILKYAGERSPLALASPEFYRQVKDPKTRSEALTRFAMGSAFMVWMGAKAAEGAITGGGPSDPEEQRRLRLTGWQPYSIKVGDRYFSYNRLAPLGLLAGIAADVHDIGQHLSKGHLEKAAVQAGAAFAKNITSQTFLKGLNDLVMAFSDPDKYVPKVLENMTTPIIPNLANQIGQAIDPEFYVARNTLDKMIARLPAKNQINMLITGAPVGPLQPRVNAFGESIKREGVGPIPNILLPGNVSIDKGSKAATEVNRLDVSVREPKLDYQGVEVPPEMYTKHAKEMGQTLKERLERVVNNPLYDKMPEFRKKERLEEIVQKVHSRYNRRLAAQLRIPIREKRLHDRQTVGQE